MGANSKIVIICVLTALMLAPVSPASAADADLDASFGGTGKVLTPLSGGGVAWDTAVLPDGKVVAVGSAGASGFQDFAALRYSTDGTLDTTFSGDGVTTTPVGTSVDIANGLAVQADGKIVAVGQTVSAAGPDAFAVVRYNTDGSLDTTFSGDGIVTTDIGTVHDRAYDVAIQSDGKLVVAGTAKGGGGYDFALVRYNTDGSLDTTFDSDGIVTTALPFDDFAFSVAIDGSGRIVAGGQWVSGGVFVVNRYLTNGSLDTSFSGDGQATQGPAGAVADIAIQPDDSIVAVGTQGRVARFLSGGTLDPAFGTSGSVLTSPGTSMTGSAVALQADGKVLIAGSAVFTDQDAVLIRYTSAGVLDTTFDTDGISQTAFHATGADAFAGLAMTPDGQAVAAGWSFNGTVNDVAIARFGDAPAPPIPDTAIDTGPSGPAAGPTHTFTFSATLPASTFECSIDAATFVPCASPLTLSGVASGAHSLAVQATVSGQADPTPASRSWTTTCSITGTTGDDMLFGTVGDDLLCGLGGKDVLKAMGGNDRLEGGSGNDRLDGGSGNDAIAGGADIDITTYSGTTTSGITADLTTHSVTGGSTFGSDQLDASVEGINGTTMADVLTGDAGANKLSGGGGGDTITGGGGSDNLAGGGGDDSLNAFDAVGGNDQANGGAGVDACTVDPGDRVSDCES